MLSFEILKFYAFWTLEQGDSTGTVIRMLHHSLYFQRRKKITVQAPWMLRGPCTLHNLYNILLHHWLRGCWALQECSWAT